MPNARVTFSLTTPTGDLRMRGSKNRVFSVQRVEHFASEALQGGKTVTISTLKVFLMLHSIIFVGLTATTSLGSPTVARVRYVQYYYVEADVPE